MNFVMAKYNKSKVRVTVIKDGMIFSDTNMPNRMTTNYCKALKYIQDNTIGSKTTKLSIIINDDCRDKLIIQALAKQGER